MCDCVQKNFLEQPYGSNSYSKCVHVFTRGRRVEKWNLDGLKQMLWNIFLCIGPAKYTKASLPARKMSLFSSIIITIILSYEIIYTILHIYLQVSETGGLAERH